MGQSIGLSTATISHIEKGRRQLGDSAREARYLLLRMSEQLPVEARSKELTNWMITTKREFDERPLGVQATITTESCRIEIEAFGEDDAELCAIHELILNYDTHFFEKSEDLVSERFYEGILTAIVRHADVDREFDPDMTADNALELILEEIRSNMGMNGQLKTKIKDLRLLNPVEDDEGAWVARMNVV